MTTVEAKRAYDIARRRAYSSRKRELRKNWYDTERAATANRKKHPRNWLTTLFGNARYRARLGGIEFSITKEDVHIPEICPVLGIKLMMGGGGRGGTAAVRDCSPSLDRVDNKLGYVPGNVHVISWRANRLKSDGTAQEIEAILNYIRRNVS